MNCSDARFALAANPDGEDAALAEHLHDCAACAAYAAEMLELDRRVLAALQVDVPGRLTKGPLPRLEPPRRGAFRSPLLALAAGAAGVAMLVALLWSAFPRESLAGAVVAHMSHEPEAWDTTAPIPPSAIAFVLARAGVRLDGEVGGVTYLNDCWFRGRYVPHFVVRSDAGPVTVMVLPHERVSRRLAFAEDGYRGVLVPAARGSVAVLSREVDGAADAAVVDAIAARALAAIRYVD